MKSTWLYVSKQFRERFRDLFWYVMDRLPDLVLVLLAVSMPVFITVLQETTTLKPPEPSRDCIRLIGSDGQAGWGGPLCFAADFSAQWYRNLVEFPTTISADCQMVGDEREKEACENRKKLIIDHLTNNATAGAVGFALGSMRR